MFLALMVVGLVGLAVMALPALGRHGGLLRTGHVAKLAPVRGAASALVRAGGARAGHASAALVHQSAWTRFAPSPRLVCSMLALYGAFGNLLVEAGLATALAAAAAIVPAAVVERFGVTPLWRWLVGFQGVPSAPLDHLVMADATAVTSFRNGRGIVSVVRDGRVVQFSAQLVSTQASEPVRVGDRLRVEDLDAKRERLSVSLIES